MSLGQTPEGALSYCISIFIQAATEVYINDGVDLIDPITQKPKSVIEVNVANNLWHEFHPNFSAAFFDSAAHWPNDTQHGRRRVEQLAYELCFEFAERGCTLR